jgi:hypothetical protein
VVVRCGVPSAAPATPGRAREHPAEPFRSPAGRADTALSGRDSLGAPLSRPGPIDVEPVHPLDPGSGVAIYDGTKSRIELERWRQA